MPIIVKHRTNLEVCSVTRNGIGLVQSVVERAKWTIGDTIQVGFIQNAKCLLLRSVGNGDEFKLAYSNGRKKTGGKVYCRGFIRNYLSTVIALPQKTITPIFPKGSDWTVALILESIEWNTEEFTKTGSNALNKDAIGVYELLGNKEVVLRIGEGKIRDRINEHLLNPRFAPPAVKSFRYLILEDSVDSKLMEKILLEEYETSVGVLPPLQQIRA